MATSDDGLLCREVGDWSTDKLRYLARYMDGFTTSMRQKWFTVYVDLFAGPGKSKIRDTGDVIKGSPMLGLDMPYRFNKYVFVDSDIESLDVLEKRVATYRDKVDVHLKPIDCNTATKDITALIPANSLTLAFVDPEGCDVHFSTVKRLADCGRVDLVITFAMGMDVKRNVDKAARHTGEDWTKYDYFFGSTKWRQAYLTALASGGWKFAIQKTMEFYKDQLKRLNYVEVNALDEIVIKSTKTNVPLYYLLFASKHPRGKDLWRKTCAITPSGQIALKLDQ